MLRWPTTSARSFEGNCVRSIRCRGAMMHTTDRPTRLHLEDSKDQIAKALDPKFAAVTPAAAAQGQQGGRRGFVDDLLEGLDPSDPDTPLMCWPDYSVRRPRY